MTVSSAIEEVPTIAADDLGLFLSQYERPMKPVVIQGATRNWPASRKWTPHYFRTVLGNSPVSVKSTEYVKRYRGSAALA